MIFETLIEKITEEFITHWNNREMDLLNSLLASNIEVSSPNISKLFPESVDNTLRNKNDVMQYWRKLNADHFFKMKLIVLGKTDRLITVLIDIGDVESKLFATFTINEYGKFSRVEITYT